MFLPMGAVQYISLEDMSIEQKCNMINYNANIDRACFGRPQTNNIRKALMEK